MDSVNNCEAIYKLIAVNYKCGRPEMAIVVKNMEKRNITVRGWTDPAELTFPSYFT